ncbi:MULTISPECIES: non-heme iron oxygenase ferredoxin subunit [Streptomyces]|uniref:Non-heme iron oxygenase ferredoxin subunit n=1 Tax=Streptomyces dengpaensis TaxID=2049881 RepID=A0ABM6T0P0_9ACTN|nr:MULTISPECIES: non-heme iron oxygenase ferredoxin subunit [Streptomyces]AVH60515.1 non-heme iron oxygenase ferredoxin subunit [Streptomyces dengpaensis]PIB07561.1 hypothetical protein B1C81_18680 [Streptomyces sp. HG99]
MTDSRYIPACELAALPEGTPVRVDIEGVAICLVNTGGEVFAIGDTCTHVQASLSEGDVEDCLIECPWRGARFDLRTGEGTKPASGPVPVYPVTVADGAVLVSLTAAQPRPSARGID